MVLIQNDVDLSSLNTLRVPAKATYFSAFKTVSELTQILNEHRMLTSKILCLGSGSNILFTQDFDGLILKNEILGIHEVEETEESILLRVGAGVIWHEFVEFCLLKGWAGIENLSLIPGTVGAAPIQNIGAYGVEVKDTIEWVEIIDIATGELSEIQASDCHFGYRDSIFKGEAKGKFIVTGVCFRLKKKTKVNISYGAIEGELKKRNIEDPSIQDVAQVVMAIRRSKLPDPKLIGNAGSFFKNPVVSQDQFDELKNKHPNIVSYPDKTGNVKLAAGWLIEQVGLKGFREGNCGVHKDQALVLVNYGGAKGWEILALANKVKQVVYAQFSVALETEVNIF
ncbi:MAG: UDP-N-acetylenolpyruvoylglucosamine reductase [Pseudomonadota bacterium]|jgi:UDP-N-acetylmuramate dehydrogenase